MVDLLKMISLTLWGFSTVVVLQYHVADGKAIATDLTYQCSRSSPHLDDCVKEGLIKVIRKFKGGNETLGVPPLDPLAIPHLETRHDETNLTLDIIMKNVIITGFSDIVFVKVTTNLDDVNKLEVTGKMFALHVQGEYVSEGAIVTFPLHSEGHFTIDMKEVSSSWVIYLKEMTRNHIKYLQIDGFDIDMMPISISFRPAQQLDGDNHLGEAVNAILNENSHEVYSVIKTRLAGVLSGVLTDFANQVLSQVPESEYLGP